MILLLCHRDNGLSSPRFAHLLAPGLLRLELRHKVVLTVAVVPGAWLAGSVFGCPRVHHEGFIVILVSDPGVTPGLEVDGHVVAVQHEELLADAAPVPDHGQGGEVRPEHGLVLGDGNLVDPLGVRPQAGHGKVDVADVALHQGVVCQVVTDQVTVLSDLLDPLQCS